MRRTNILSHTILLCARISPRRAAPIS
ncbi:hypothetical protein GGD62_006210 [Bradyrhizobium sp. ERR14]|nr:hypothetical protein [Bradyrhizobium sp. ERR14]